MELYPYPRFSLEERDRRWSKVRGLMQAQELSAIVSPANSGHSTDFQANSRYLSHCGGGPDADITVVFPLEGDVTVGATSAAPRWPTVQEWVTDVREARRNYGNVVIERLRELDVDGTRVGVTGLGRGTRTPEGTILFHTMRRMLREFPNTTFVDATELLDEARIVKTEEEIDFLTRSTELSDMAFDTARQTAAPGVLDYVVWAEATATMLRNGGEPTMHFHWVSGPAPARTLTRASHRRLERGDIILNELEGCWAGYRAQGVQPIAVGECDPSYVELSKLQVEIFERLLPRLTPGATFGELAESVQKASAELRPSRGPASDATARLVMHGRGQGDDGPIITNTATDPYQLRKELRENMVCIVKPEVRRGDGRYPINWGDTVVITPQGGRRLGKREPGIWIA
ncbi:M24 family metallopeptidase [Egicoccus sp. AB-alg6-2]|uniref:M24 family metallopeptidase n=1 Tax=Egicoccus sp. AB-alg6-2 TaxID=3242692 RepID=UPI00359DFB80